MTSSFAAECIDALHAHHSWTWRSADNRSMLQRRHDHDNLEVQRRENERLKKREKKWKEDQKHLAEQQADVEASAVNNQLAHLGPTPSRPGTHVTRTCYLGNHLE